MGSVGGVGGVGGWRRSLTPHTPHTPHTPLPLKPTLCMRNPGSCRVGDTSALKYKGRARCLSHKTSKIIPQICNAIIPPCSEI
ncbi:MAG: hypothetical protein V7K71_12720 [Nostoc sp.]|uniref:hypothetical protein n=1 Tax=Nostoc sp. TaxID=1180 RepID=UPI002FF8C9DB